MKENVWLVAEHPKCNHMTMEVGGPGPLIFESGL